MKNFKEKLKIKIKREWGIDVSDYLIEIIIQNEQKIKMVKEMGKV